MKYFVMFILSALFLQSGIALAEEQAGWLQQIPIWVEALSQVFFGLMVVATILVRVIPGDKDDIAVEKYTSKILKYLSYLPTFGINPRTKKLQEALADAQIQLKESKGSKGDGG